LLIDTLLAIGMFVLGVVNLNEINASDFAALYARPSDAWNTIIIAVLTLPLAARRRYPRSVVAVTTGAFILDRLLDYPNTFASAGIILAVHAIGSELEPAKSLRIGVPLVVGLAAFVTVGAWSRETVGVDAVVATTGAAAIPLILGREVNMRRRRLQELEERATRAEREREEAARRAVEEERARIARELHDMVAHQMTVMTIHAEAAGRLAARADPRIGESLEVIKASGREALAEMRRMVGLLRGPDDRKADLTPQPGLERIDELLGSMREAGLTVDVAIEGDPRPLAPAADLNAYRIIQEALTNSLRHGGPDTRARLTLGFGDERLAIDVVDDGRGAAALETAAGHGLVGMRERVAVLDGTFRAGPRPGGGFAVHADFPVAG